MSRWLYIFAGFPGKGPPTGTQHFKPGGLQHCIERVEKLAKLEHDKYIRLKKEGVFIGLGEKNEHLEDFQVVLSPTLEPVGITWEWFNENHGFGNGVTVAKSSAHYPTKTVVHGTQSTTQSLLDTGEVVDFSKLQQVHNRTEGWTQYEQRWVPGTCPEETHVVHLTWLVAKEKISSHAYRRLWHIIEGQAEMDLRGYQEERHLTQIRDWNGKAGFGRLRGGHVVPGLT